MNKHTPPQNAASIHLIYETTVTLLFSLINLKAQREHWWFLWHKVEEKMYVFSYIKNVK